MFLLTEQLQFISRNITKRQFLMNNNLAVKAELLLNV